MNLINTIHHKTANGVNKPLAELTDKEFEEFLDENGFEIVVNKGGWSLESRERTVKAMVDIVNKQIAKAAEDSDQ